MKLLYILIIAFAIAVAYEEAIRARGCIIYPTSRNW